MIYEEYEVLCQKELDRNAQYLQVFEQDMIEAGLSDNTIGRHLSNVDFFINTYLLRAEPQEMRIGVIHLNEFLGNFYIRKCMWSTPGTIKSTAASLKKFYKCMSVKGYVQNSEYQLCCQIIKDNMANWQEDCECYNNPDLENPFDYF